MLCQTLHALLLRFFFCSPSLFQFQIICVAQRPTQSVFFCCTTWSCRLDPKCLNMDYFTVPQQSLMHRIKRAQQAPTGLSYTPIPVHRGNENGRQFWSCTNRAHFISHFHALYSTLPRRIRQNWKNKSWSTRASLQGTCVQNWLGFKKTHKHKRRNYNPENINQPKQNTNSGESL